MNAVIMAGGYGNRLIPLTEALPKPMLGVANRPMLDYSVAQLKHYGIKNIVFTLGYRPQDVIAWAIGYKGIACHFSVEENPLGTLGGIKAAASLLDDVFVVLSGDGLNNINLKAMQKAHKKSGALVTAAIKKVANPALYGVVQTGEKGIITGFMEKPHSVIEPAFVNCGTYIVNKSALSLVEKENADFARDLFPILVNAGKLGYYLHEGYWQDAGDFASYFQSNFDMLSASFFPFARNSFEDEYAAKTVGSSLVSISAALEGEAIDSIIGKGCFVEKGCRVEKCIVADNTLVSGNKFGSILIGDEVIEVLKREDDPVNYIQPNNAFLGL